MLVVLTGMTEFCWVTSLTTGPVAYIVGSKFVLEDAESMFFVLGVFPVVDILFGFPLEAKAMLDPLIQILSLPTSKIAPSIKIPNQANISSNQHSTICILLYNQILIRYLQLMKYFLSSLIKLLTILIFKY